MYVNCRASNISVCSLARRAYFVKREAQDGKSECPSLLARYEIRFTTDERRATKNGAAFVNRVGELRLPSRPSVSTVLVASTQDI